MKKAGSAPLAQARVERVTYAAGVLSIAIAITLAGETAPTPVTAVLTNLTPTRAIAVLGRFGQLMALADPVDRAGEQDLLRSALVAASAPGAGRSGVVH